MSDTLLAAVGPRLARLSARYRTVPGVRAVVRLAGRVDGWRCLYGITIVLLFCGTSSQHQLVAVGYHGRYAAAGVLAWWTYHQPGRRAARSASLRIPRRLLVGGLWLAVALAALSTVWSADLVSTVEKTLVLAMLAMIVHGLMTRRWGDTTRIAGDFAVVFTALTATFVASLVAGAVGVPDTRMPDGRFQGLYSNPNTLGMACLVALPIGWALHRHGRNRLYLIALVPAVVALVLSECRTAIVALAAGAVWVTLRTGLAATARVAGAIALCLAVLAVSAVRRALLAPYLLGPLVARFAAGGHGDGIDDRTPGWRAALDLLRSRPWTGYGYAAGPAVFQHMRDTGLLAFHYNLAHNSYLQWLLELGLIGAVPLAALLAACAWALLRGELRGIGAGLVWVVFAGLLLQVTESVMFGTGQPYPFVFWLAVAGALRMPGRAVDA
jgi:O-antigen ligase